MPSSSQPSGLAVRISPCASTNRQDAFGPASSYAAVHVESPMTVIRIQGVVTARPWLQRLRVDRREKQHAFQPIRQKQEFAPIAIFVQPAIRHRMRRHTTRQYRAIATSKCRRPTNELVPPHERASSAASPLSSAGSSPLSARDLGSFQFPAAARTSRTARHAHAVEMIATGRRIGTCRKKGNATTARSGDREDPLLPYRAQPRCFRTISS